MDLTTLARAKAYLGQTSSAQDVMISALISRASDAIIQWTSRAFNRVVHTDERFDGTGSATIMITSYPVISVEKVQIDGTIIQQSLDALAAGWQNDDKFLYLFGGYKFTRGIRNVLMSWTSGFTDSETDFIPGSAPYTITPTHTTADGSAFAATDLGVIFTSNSQPLTRVGSNPLASQYSFADGVYTFNAANTGTSVKMSYDYVPGAIEQAAIELVSFEIKHRDTLGLQSKSLAGESITFDNKIPESVQRMLDGYRRTVPYL